ncbi:APC family permease [Candidatus Accumulibacter sp. ACC003]|uniref:APC family permease n=1 Tax=Candidatus Accumulibacter sp. ACC003 TaxID=2823334 RepID=UPI0025C2F706|nr:APC family permease [Candidatus Accumulibacter sp. ACC003]
MKQESGSGRISVRGAIALGVGSMVGAGIFALMGEAAARAGSAVWLSFLIAGIIALLTGYSFAQLGVRYPSRGGVVEYLVKAYGPGLFSGGCSILFYIAQLIGMAMISLAFGKFAAKLLGLGETDLLFWERLLASALIVGLAALNLVGAKFVSTAQRLVVLANLALLALFTLGLSTHADVARLSVETWPAASSILGSLGLTFFAFTGFAVVSNAAEDMAYPTRDLPRAMYATIGIVLLLYVALALAVTASVDGQSLTSSGATLLAVVARHNFGAIGFHVLLVSAILATVTCLNGGFFGATSITYTLAENGQLPSRFGQKIGMSSRGLTISAALALVMVNFLTLTTVASLGSATSLLVYSLVNFGAWRLLKGGGWHRVAILLSIVACLLAIVVWAFDTFQTSPGSFAIFLSFLVIAFVAEGLLQRYHGRKILAQEHWETS